MSRENPTWGAPRIVSELALLGHDVAQQTVAKYMVRTRKPPSQTWRTFLDNHVPDIAACDFFTVPTVTFRGLYVLSAPRAPRQNPYCERVIGSIRRECLDHVIILNEAHLKRILTDHFEYYHLARPHRNSPTPREVEAPSQGEVVSIPQVGGLHHRYSRAA